MLEFREVSYQSNNKIIIQNINVKIEHKDFVTICGPSGSGKSTFLKLCCHLICPTGGEIYYNGQNFMDYCPIELRSNIGFCSQNPVLFGNIVMDNLSYPFLIRKLPVKAELIKSLLDTFGLSEEILKQDIMRLSGGEKQRIALIRTLLLNPKVLLLDEVTSALDIHNTETVERVIKKLNREGTTIIWVTHNQEQSKRIATHMFEIHNGCLTSS